MESGGARPAYLKGTSDGQKKPVPVYLLVTEATIEEKLLATLSAKHDLALAALDMESDIKEVGSHRGWKS